MKKNDICVVILDKGPQKHSIPIGHNVLVDSTLKKDDFPIRCVVNRQVKIYFRLCELKKIGEL